MKFSVQRRQDSADTVILGYRDSGGIVRKLPFSFSNCTIKRFPGMVTISQVAESLPSIHKALGSVPNTAQT